MRCRTLSVAALAVLAAARTAGACDICSIYTSREAREARLGFYTAAFQQYTDFSTLRQDGDEVDNSLGQSLESSQTQLIVGYQVSHRLGVQVNVPYLDRSFRRPAGDVVESGSESGLGDVALLANWRALERFGNERIAVWSLHGGVKLPTGDSGRLREELEGHHDEEPDHHAEGVRAVTGRHGDEHHGPASGVGGHDLALGSGSVDGVVGTSGFVSWRRLFAAAQVQYALRTEGDHGYRYANDFTWSVEPGVYVWLHHGRSLSVGAQLFGEDKGDDELDGEPLPDTAMSAVYAGPKLTYSHGGGLFAELAVDLPLRQETSDLQIVPDSRVRFGLTLRPGLGSGGS
jgi:hypothetical protein